MTIPELIKELDSKLKAANEEHVALHKELYPLSNKLVEGEELKRAQEIVFAIQDSYQEMHPALMFIGNHYKFACDFMTSYTDWIKKLNEMNNIQDTGEPAQKGIIIH